MPEPLTAERLAEIKARAEKACAHVVTLRYIADEIYKDARVLGPNGADSVEDASVALGRLARDVPDLVAEVERLREAIHGGVHDPARHRDEHEGAAGDVGMDHGGEVMTTPLTTERLAEIKARAEKATAGPWGARRVGMGPSVYSAHDDRAVASLGNARRYPSEGAANALFIAHSRQDVPDLVAEVERLREENADLVDAIEMALGGLREPLTLSDARNARGDLVRVFNAAKKRLARQRQEAGHA